MSELTRRDAIKMAAAAGAAAHRSDRDPFHGRNAQMFGHFWVYCKYCGKADKVSGAIRNHACRTPKCNKVNHFSVKDGEGRGGVRKRGHHPIGNKVSGPHRAARVPREGLAAGQCKTQRRRRNANN